VYAVGGERGRRVVLLEGTLPLRLRMSRR